MIEETKKDQIIFMREKGLTISQIAKALEVSETSVKKYSSGNPDKDNEDLIISKRKNPLKDDWMIRLFGNDWNDNNELMQLFFNLNRLAIETDRDLDEFLVKIEFMIRQYHRYSDTPLKLYDFSLNIASIMTFISETFDMGLFVSKVENFIDKSIFLDKLNEVISERKQEKADLDEKLINLQIEVNNLMNTKTLLMAKILGKDTEEELMKCRFIIQEFEKRYPEQTLELANELNPNHIAEEIKK